MPAPQFRRAARKRLLNQVLAEREKQYHLLAHNSLDLISRRALDGTYLYVSPASDALLGYTPDEMVGHRLYEFLHPDDVADAQAIHEDVITSRVPHVMTYRVRCKNGDYIWLESNVSTIENPETQAVEEMIGVSRDITTRKEVEKALYENVTLFRSLFEFASEGILLANATGHLILVNSRIEAMFGYTRFELLGKPVELLLPEQLKDAHQQHRQAYDAHPEVRAMGAGLELLGRRKDGSVFPIDVSLSPLQIEGGRMVMALVTDVTRRQQAEQQIRTAHEQMQAIVESMEHVVFTLDVVQNKLLFMSESCEKIYGLPVEAFMKNPYAARSLVLAEDRDMMTANDARLREGKTITSIYRIQHPQRQEIRWIEAKIKPQMSAEGQLLRLHGIITDITERRRAARLAVAGEIATGVAHQINNPLTTVIAEAHLLIRRFSPDSREYESLHEIQSAAYRAGGIVQRLLNLARAQVGTMLRLNLNQSLQMAVGLVRPQLQPHVAQLTLDLAPDLPPVIGSEEHLQDVWVNLLINAKEAVLETPQPIIHLTTSFNAANKMVEVRITDNGHGIPVEHREHIFDPFYTTKEQGAGLGLSICHDVVVHHGGSIHVQSEVGVGTTFTVRLPAGVLLP